jgi:hypothetical protein
MKSQVHKFLKYKIGLLFEELGCESGTEIAYSDANLDRCANYIHVFRLRRKERKSGLSNTLIVQKVKTKIGKITSERIREHVMNAGIWRLTLQEKNRVNVRWCCNNYRSTKN